MLFDMSKSRISRKDADRLQDFRRSGSSNRHHSVRPCWYTKSLSRRRLGTNTNYHRHPLTISTVHWRSTGCLPREAFLRDTAARPSSSLWFRQPKEQSGHWSCKRPDSHHLVPISRRRGFRKFPNPRAVRFRCLGHRRGSRPPAFSASPNPVDLGVLGSPETNAVRKFARLKTTRCGFRCSKGQRAEGTKRPGAAPSASMALKLGSRRARASLYRCCKESWYPKEKREILRGRVGLLTRERRRQGLACWTTPQRRSAAQPAVPYRAGERTPCLASSNRRQTGCLAPNERGGYVLINARAGGIPSHVGFLRPCHKRDGSAIMGFRWTQNCNTSSRKTLKLFPLLN